MIKISLLKSKQNCNNNVLITVLEQPIYIAELTITGHEIIDNHEKITDDTGDTLKLCTPACNGISSIMYGTLNAIDKLCPASINVIISKNMHRISITNKKNKVVKILLNILITQLLTVQKRFSSDVSVIISEKKLN